MFAFAHYDSLSIFCLSLCAFYSIRSAKVLRAAGIPTTIILDAAVGYVIDKVDMVLVGAEGVVENGGLINQIGSYQMAIVAKAANKPFYAVAERYVRHTSLVRGIYNVSFINSCFYSFSFFLCG